MARLSVQLALKESELARSENLRQRAVRRFEERQADIQMLEELGRYLTSSLALNKVMEHIYQSFSVLDAEVFLLGLYDEQQQMIDVPMLIVRQQPQAHVQVQMSDQLSPAVWCIEQQQEMVILKQEDNFNYFTPEQLAQKCGEQMGSIIYQPLMVGERIVGCLSVQNSRVDGFNKEQLDTIRTLSAYSSIAVANALGYQQLSHTLDTLKSTQKRLVLQEKMASLGTLTAGVAHEINNPVNFSHVGAENLAVDLARFKAFLIELANEDADPEVLASLHQHFAELFDHINTIKDGTRRIKSIVQDLRAFTSIEHADKDLVDVAESIQSTVNLISAKNVDVTEFVTNFCYVPAIYCYPTQLNQAFLNIITNSCDAIWQKQQTQDSTELGEVYISCQQVDDSVHICFGDNGCGMDEATLNKVFEPFFTTKEVGKGTGLGMAVTFGIIKEHGGRIEMSSTLGKGTKVQVFLPVSSD